MICLKEDPKGTILPVWAQPGARRMEITGDHDGALKIAVSAVAEKGKANRAIVKQLAEVLNIPKSSIELIGGETSRSKKYLLRDVSIESIQKALEAVLGDTTA